MFNRRHLIATGALATSLALAPVVHADPRDEGHRPPGGGSSEDGKQARPGKPGAGARSIGDPLFPQIGNGGYDAQHYDLRLTYDPVTRVLDGRTVMTARATQSLTEFSLDFQGLSGSTSG